MIQGTKRTENGYVCLVCGEVVAEHIEDIPNYCPNCGAALKLESLVERKKFVREEQLKVVEKLKVLSEEDITLEKSIELLTKDIENN